MLGNIISFILALTVVVFTNWILHKKMNESEYLKFCILFMGLAVFLPFFFFGANCRLANIGLMLSIFQLNGLVSLIAMTWILLGKTTKRAFWVRFLIFTMWIGVFIVMIPALFVFQLMIFC